MKLTTISKREKKYFASFLSIKLDLSKAYDRVKWPFLEKMMQQMGFPLTWIRKVMVV